MFILILYLGSRDCRERRGNSASKHSDCSKGGKLHTEVCASAALYFSADHQTWEFGEEGRNERSFHQKEKESEKKLKTVYKSQLGLKAPFSFNLLECKHKCALAELVNKISPCKTSAHYGL